MSCLVCQWFAATEPPAHREAREKSNCAHGCGREWNNHTVIAYVHNHKKPLQGWCLLNPEPLQKSSLDVCGQISPIALNWWFLGNEYKPLKPNENLIDWARSIFALIRDGALSVRIMEATRAENTRLKQQLNKSRARAKARLEKLKAVKSVKAPPKPKLEIEIPWSEAAE
jgi:hypothetical protein